MRYHKIDGMKTKVPAISPVVLRGLKIPGNSFEIIEGGLTNLIGLCSEIFSLRIGFFNP